MSEQFSRTELLIGEEGIRRLQEARVAVFGLGGVGGYVVEALARSGIGHFDLTDNDIVSVSNMNRQIIATWQTVGRYKTEVMKERILSINPKAEIKLHNCFYLPETAGGFDFRQYSYVVDAVDTVTAKIDIIMRAKEAGAPVISCMGAGNKMDPAAFRTADIYETSVCPLARVMRRELKKRGIQKLKVVYSTEPPIQGKNRETDGGQEIENRQETDGGQGIENKQETERGQGIEEAAGRRTIPGSIAFVPSVAGLILAGEVIRDLACPETAQAR